MFKKYTSGKRKKRAPRTRESAVSLPTVGPIMIVQVPNMALLHA